MTALQSVRAPSKGVQLAVMFAVLAMMALSVVAGNDNTFGGPVNTLTSWLTGTMGKLFAIGALAVGLAIGIVKQSVMAVAVGVGIALAANAGPAVLGAIFSAAL